MRYTIPANVPVTLPPDAYFWQLEAPRQPQERATLLEKLTAAGITHTEELARVRIPGDQVARAREVIAETGSSAGIAVMTDPTAEQLEAAVALVPGVVHARYAHIGEITDISLGGFSGFERTTGTLSANVAVNLKVTAIPKSN